MRDDSAGRRVAYHCWNVCNARPARVPGDIWTDIPPLSRRTKERTGYPTQKPLALLQRNHPRIQQWRRYGAGSILRLRDCLCCIWDWTSQWIGIDVSSKAYDLVKSRLKKEVNVGATEEEGEHEPIFWLWGLFIARTFPADRKGKKSKNIRHIRYGRGRKARCNGCLEHFHSRTWRKTTLRQKLAVVQTRTTIFSCYAVGAIARKVIEWRMMNLWQSLSKKE